MGFLVLIGKTLEKHRARCPHCWKNLVAIELLRRYGLDSRMFFYNREIEVDFYMPDESLAILVCHNPRKNEEIRQRQIITAIL